MHDGDALPPFGLVPTDELCSACYNEHPEPRGNRCPVAAWETARRHLADLVETMDAGLLPAAQSLAIRGQADLMAVELEQGLWSGSERPVVRGSLHRVVVPAESHVHEFNTLSLII
jgi:hypothetical protein